MNALPLNRMPFLAPFERADSSAGIIAAARAQGDATQEDHGAVECLVKRPPSCKGGESDQSDGSDDDDLRVLPLEPLDEQLGRRSAFLRLLYELNHAREDGLTRATSHGDAQRAVSVDRACEDVVADTLVDGHGLARDRGLVDRGRPIDDRAIGRDPLARPDDDDLADRDCLRAHALLSAVSCHDRILRVDRHEGLDVALRPRARVALERPARREDEDEQCAVEPVPDERSAEGGDDHQEVHVQLSVLDERPRAVDGLPVSAEDVACREIALVAVEPHPAWDASQPAATKAAQSAVVMASPCRAHKSGRDAGANTRREFDEVAVAVIASPTSRTPGRRQSNPRRPDRASSSDAPRDP